MLLFGGKINNPFCFEKASKLTILTRKLKITIKTHVSNIKTLEDEQLIFFLQKRQSEVKVLKKGES